MAARVLASPVSGLMLGIGVGMYISYRYIWFFIKYAQEH